LTDSVASPWHFIVVFSLIEIKLIEIKVIEDKKIEV